MFKKKEIDSITNMEKESNRKLGFISDFINQLNDAKDDSKAFALETQNNIDRLKVVLSDCKKVENFVNKVLK